MKRSTLLFLIALLLVSATVFSATFFPMRYLSEREREKCDAREAEYEREVGELLASIVPADTRYSAEQLRQVLDYIEKNSIFPLPAQGALTEAMIEAILDAMGDRHGAYYNAEEYGEFRSSIEGNSFGVGVTVAESREGYIEVLLVHRGSPIDGVGAVGDLITHIDGRAVAALGYEAALECLRGEESSELCLTVLRGGEAIVLPPLVRGAYEKQTVVSRVIEAEGVKLGYLHLTGFDGHTYKQLRAAVSDLRLAGVSGVIFDMRNNPGGLLWQVARVLAYVLPDGDIVHVDYASERLADYTITAKDGYLLSENTRPEEYFTGGHELSLPLAVLVNGGTASAAELFTAAIRDYAAEGKITATVVGTTTYGKGTVQMTDTGAAGEAGAALKISIAYYNPPCNISYDGTGITPDVTVELPSELSGTSVLKLTEESDTQLQAAIAALITK